jgi:hypothetical protein
MVNMSMAMNKHAKIQELLEIVFSIQSVPGQYSKDHQRVNNQGEYEGSQCPKTVKCSHGTHGTWNQEPLHWLRPAEK